MSVLGMPSFTPTARHRAAAGGRSSRRRALIGCIFVATCAGRAAATEVEPEWIGSVVRGRIDPGVVERTRGSLERALLRHGVAVLDTSATSEEAVREAMESARTSLEDARSAWRDDDAGRVLEETRTAVDAFARGPAFAGDESAWSLYRDALLLRAEALVSMGQRNEAATTVRALLAAMPTLNLNHMLKMRREQASPQLLALVEEVRREVASMPRASLEVRSVPSGADVIVDGRERGLTPLLIDDAIPGPHFVAVVGPGGRFTERVVVGEDGARVLARLGGRNLSAVRSALETIREPSEPAVFTGAIGRASEDALVAVLVPAGKRVEIVAARVRAGVVRSVSGARVPDSDNDRERATFLLIETLLAEGRDAWVDTAASEDPSSLRERLFTGMGAVDMPDEPSEEEREIAPATIAVGILAGVAVLGGVATGLGVYAWREARKADGFTFTVATGDL